MRNVNTYHRSTLAAPTSGAVRPRGSERAKYTASGTVVPMATRRPILLARRSSSLVQLGHKPPIAMPGVSVPHLAHGWLGPNPLDHGAGEFGRRSTSPLPPPPIHDPDFFLFYRRLHRATHPLACLHVSPLIQPHPVPRQPPRR